MKWVNIVKIMGFIGFTLIPCSLILVVISNNVFLDLFGVISFLLGCVAIIYSLGQIDIQEQEAKE